MNPFPKEIELIEFFETEPKVADKGIPWTYNELTFHTTRGEDQIKCIIWPGEEKIHLIWEKQGREVLNLEVAGIIGLSLSLEKTHESMKAIFRERDALMPLELQLKPHIRVSWGKEHV